MKKFMTFSAVALLLVASLTASAQSTVPGDGEESKPKLDSKTEGAYCPPCMEQRALALKLGDNSQTRERVVDNALGTDTEAGRKGRGQTQ